MRNFSLQVKLLPISIYGWGFFKMDFPFLVDVITKQTKKKLIKQFLIHCVAGVLCVCLVSSVNIFVESRNFLALSFRLNKPGSSTDHIRLITRPLAFYSQNLFSIFCSFRAMMIFWMVNVHKTLQFGESLGISVYGFRRDNHFTVKTINLL